MFRFLLVSQSDVTSLDMWTRLERFYLLDGGCNCAAIFLLHPQDEGRGIISFTIFRLGNYDGAGPLSPFVRFVCWCVRSLC